MTDQKPLEERCRMTIIRDAEGKARHFEIECDTKEDRDEMTTVFENEAVIRVKPQVAISEESPVSEPVAIEQT